MKRFTTVLLVLVLAASVLSFAACNQIDAGQDWAKVQENGVLRVGMECDYAPFNWTQDTDADGAVPIVGLEGKFANGFDVKIAKFVAEELGVELEIHRLEWESLLPALKAGTIDAIAAGMSPTADRREAIDFSEHYYESNLVVVVRKDGNYANATSIADLQGANIVAQRSTYHAIALEQIKTVKAIDLREDFVSMITALKANAIDGYIAEEPGAITNCERENSFIYIPLVNNSPNGFEIDETDNVALSVGLRKNSTLTAEIDKILKDLTDVQRETFMDESIAQQP